MTLPTTNRGGEPPLGAETHRTRAASKAAAPRPVSERTYFTRELLDLVQTLAERDAQIRNPIGRPISSFQLATLGAFVASLGHAGDEAEHH